MTSENGNDASAAPVITPETVPLVMSQTLLVASLLFAVLCLGILVFFTRRKSRANGKLLLLVGAPDSGKTAILSQLVYREALPTHTSLQTNASVVALENKSLTVVDIPGHPRIRSQVSEHVADAKTIVFVVDASTISRNGPAVAEHLHLVLNAVMSLPPSHTLPALLILAHKTDLIKSGAVSTAAEAQAITRVKTILERELEKRKVSQAGGVGIEGLGEEGEKTEMGGLESTGEKGVFRFESWDGGDVAFMGTSTRNQGQDSDGLLSLRGWLQDNA